MATVAAIYLWLKQDKIDRGEVEGQTTSDVGACCGEADPAARGLIKIGRPRTASALEPTASSPREGLHELSACHPAAGTVTADAPGLPARPRSVARRRRRRRFATTRRPIRRALRLCYDRRGAAMVARTTPSLLVRRSHDVGADPGAERFSNRTKAAAQASAHIRTRRAIPIVPAVRQAHRTGAIAAWPTRSSAVRRPQHERSRPLGSGVASLGDARDCAQR
jgi:hypothetical protein